jgi:hypothetical protein
MAVHGALSGHAPCCLTAYQCVTLKVAVPVAAFPSSVQVTVAVPPDPFVSSCLVQLTEPAAGTVWAVP